MEIITERHKRPSEIVPVTESESSIKDEINKRTCKAGYTDSDGQPKIRMAEIVSKSPSEKYRKNYVKIFKHE